MKYSALIAFAHKRLEEMGDEDRITRFRGEASGCESGRTSITNRQYFNQLYLKMRLIDSKWADTSTELFGCKLRTPIMSGAMSGASLQEMAKGIAEAGSMFWVGICSNEVLRSIFEEDAPVVKISKPYVENEKIIENIGYAEDLGAVAVGIDIDFFFCGKVGDNLRLANLMGPKTLNDLKDIISTVNLPFILKGILSVDDALKAREAGAKAIVVSNHGAAVLDHAAHSLQILPKVIEVMNGELDILVDSGFRRGIDVLKGLALGAKGVLMGTNTLLGLYANGAEGVKDMFTAITDELRRGMSITGCANVNEITKDILIF